jgi:glutamine---fructose-6-phosphate transaminase (isomerizing)
LIDEKTPVFVFSLLDPISYTKLVSNVQEAKARGAHIVSLGFEGQVELQELSDLWFELPLVEPLLAPLAMTGLMQLFVCGIALHLNLPIDKPRNLAKSVTVE